MQSDLTDQVSRLACDRCYRRKARCDKLLPSCSSCLNAGALCCYNARSNAGRREDVEFLERRLRQLEAKNAALSKKLHETQSAGQRSDHRTWEARADSTPEVGEIQPEDMDVSNNEGEGDKSDNENEVTKQVVSLSQHAGRQKHYLGSASGAILANLLGLHVPGQYGQMQMHVQIQMDGDNDEETLFRRFATQQQSHGPGKTESCRNFLPPEQLARSLLAAYLCHDHICYPYLHPRRLMETITMMYAEDNDNYYDTHVVEAYTMDIIFAIGTTQVHKYSWQVMPDAETHHERAISKLGLVLERGGLVALQSLMLLCQYRMLSVSYSTSASLWHLLGMAARLGLELGLHREAVYTISPSHGLSPAAENELKQNLEIKRRCFWSLFGMDRVVSNTLGRPMAINLHEIDTAYPSVDESTDMFQSPSVGIFKSVSCPKWSETTAIFAHITWHRVIMGKILSHLHNTPKSRMPDAPALLAIRRDIAEELDRWRAGVALLPLATPNSGGSSTNNKKQQDKSTFKSPNWYNLLYHNSILMLYRPTHGSSELAPTSQVLEQIYQASRQSIRSYEALYKTRTLNYTWITLHAVFIVGLSFVYALRTHFQSKRRQWKSWASGASAAAVPMSLEAQLSSDPTIAQIVADTRSCSTVLIALSERWNTARGCPDVFGRLSDAVLADASDFLVKSAQQAVAQTQTQAVGAQSYVDVDRERDREPIHMTKPPSTDQSRPGKTLVPFDLDPSSLNADGDGDGDGQAVSFRPELNSEYGYEDCFEELEELFGHHYGDDALTRPPYDWAFDTY